MPDAKVKLGEGQIRGNGLFGEAGYIGIDPKTGEVTANIQGVFFGICGKG